MDREGRGGEGKGGEGRGGDEVGRETAPPRHNPDYVSDGTMFLKLNMFVTACSNTAICIVGRFQATNLWKNH
jgi:hypothetical protein